MPVLDPNETRNPASHIHARAASAFSISSSLGKSFALVLLNHADITRVNSGRMVAQGITECRRPSANISGYVMHYGYAYGSSFS